ncbi:AtpZ/AtpI family protein [Micromonospora sp. NPDC003197]
MADNLHPQKSDDESSEGVAGSVVGYLIAGIGVWGFLGWLVDRWFDLPSGVGLVTGMMIGAVGAIYLIIRRLGA